MSSPGNEAGSNARQVARSARSPAIPKAAVRLDRIWPPQLGRLPMGRFASLQLSPFSPRRTPH